MNRLISGESLQELADLTIIYNNQDHLGLVKDQLPNTNCDYITIDGDVTVDQIDKISSAKSIFVYTHALDLFFNGVFKKIVVPFTLITHNSDHGITDRFLKYLDDDRIIAWFCQNMETSHKKLFAIPIGLANSQWPHGNFDLIKSIKNKNLKKDILVFKNFDVGTNHSERSQCDHITSQNGIPMSPSRDIVSYWEYISRSKFIISPWGGGVDCHRVWECLFLNTIPIVKYHIAHSQWEHLPILFIDNWADVTESFLRDKIKDYPDKFEIDELDIKYWENTINSFVI